MLLVAQENQQPEKILVKKMILHNSIVVCLCNISVSGHRCLCIRCNHRPGWLSW